MCSWTAATMEHNAGLKGYPYMNLWIVWKLDLTREATAGYVKETTNEYPLPDLKEL